MRFYHSVIFLFSFTLSFAQLKDVKILTPREVGFITFDFMQFMPDERYFVVLANSIAVYNTETAEIVDEYDLGFGAKNLSVSRDGQFILATVNAELYIFTFSEQRLKLHSRLSSADLLAGQPNSQYYTAMPIGGCFFVAKPSCIYVSIGAYTMVYDYISKKTLSSHVFPASETIMHAAEYAYKGEVILSVANGSVYSLVRQSQENLSNLKEITKNRTVSSKIKVRDSLLCCFNLDVYYLMNLNTGRVSHEVRAPVYDYSMYGSSYQTDYLKELNKRPAISVPDTVNFASDEYVHDIDLLPAEGIAIYVTSKAIKHIRLSNRKLLRSYPLSAGNLRLSAAKNRMVVNMFYPYKALRIYQPENMQLIAERKAMGNSVLFTSMSPAGKWLYTGCGAAGYLWDMFNFTKHAEIRDISGSDSSFIYNAFFLSDSELVVNSGLSLRGLNLSIYNIPRKKITKVLKKDIYALASGFMNGEFYYCDMENLHILNLKNGTEETYRGMFSLAASDQYKIINFTSELVFVPESGKYKIINRKTKKAGYENESWAVNSRVLISEDNKYVYTSAQIKKKKNYGGTEVEVPSNAIVRIDMQKKAIVNDYAETWHYYDFKLKDGGKIIGIWYTKSNYENGQSLSEVLYSEYEVESGKEKSTVSLVTTPQMISTAFTSVSGKYFAISDYAGQFMKVFDSKGALLLDLSDTRISAPKCFFLEDREMLVITSPVSSLATFYDLKRKVLIGQLANAAGDDYFMVTRDLCYLGSKDFVKQIRFKHNSEMFSFDQFDAYLNQPHRVLREFRCADSALIQAYESAYLKRMKVLGLKPGSKINFSVLPSIQTVNMREEGEGNVNFSISANKGQHPLASFQVINNGSIIHSGQIPAGKEGRFETSLTFETSSGINRFEFIVKDAAGMVSPRITRFYNNTRLVQPDLYLVVIASEKFKNSDFDLSYAVKDASDVAATMSNSKAFKNIHIKKLINQNFVSDTVKDLKTFFAKAGVNDLVMVFYAGHGYLDSDLSYYFPTYYTDFSDPKINSVAYNAFENLFKEMKPIRKLMFIDACFSGEVDADELKPEKKKKNARRDSSRTATANLFSQSTALEMSKAVFADLRQNSGVTVISSAGGTEAAYEDEKWNNGLFTYCLINGMKNLKADQNKDKKVTLNELQKHVSEEVNRLSEGKQRPTYRVENTVLDYELW